jgi:8-oxo-dGTP pyrophosphatase MutT (NUDIX family)
MRFVLLLVALLLVFRPLLAGAEGVPAGIVLYARTPEGVKLLLADHTAPPGKPGRGWAAFGGAHEGRETPAETAARETEEETHGYFKATDLAKKLEGRKPFMDSGFAIFFVEVDFVPVSELLKVAIPSDNPAYVERGPFTWVPYTQIAPLLDRKLPGDARPRLEAGLVPAGAATDWFWPVWINNLRAAKAAGAVPWLSADS